MQIDFTNKTTNQCPNNLQPKQEKFDSKAQNQIIAFTFEYFSHEDFVHPEVIFSENVSLMSLDHEQVLFAVSNAEVHLHSVGPFYPQNQYRNLYHIIRQVI